MYIVVDFYEDPSGEIIYRSDSVGNCKDFIYKYIEDKDGKCDLKIFTKGVNRRNA